MSVEREIHKDDEGPRLLRLEQVLGIIPMSISTPCRDIRMGLFPPPLKLHRGLTLRFRTGWQNFWSNANTYLQHLAKLFQLSRPAKQTQYKNERFLFVNCAPLLDKDIKTIKNELVWRTSFQTSSKATIQLGKYIDGFYNPSRRHSALDYKSPVKFEAEMAIKE